MPNRKCATLCLVSNTTKKGISGDRHSALQNHAEPNPHLNAIVGGFADCSKYNQKMNDAVRRTYSGRFGLTFPKTNRTATRILTERLENLS
jgi:hypothetical protein